MKVGSLLKKRTSCARRSITSLYRTFFKRLPNFICVLLLLSTAVWGKGGGLAPIFENLGEYHFPIRANTQAQQYFDQGMLLFYGFDYAESVRSMRGAIASDKNCAMCEWGLALALGSLTNTPLDGTERKQVIKALKHAKKIAKTPVEKDLIKALSVRYARGPKPKVQYKGHKGHHGSKLVYQDEAKNFVYEMRKIIKKYPNAKELDSIFAYALFNAGNWNFWDKEKNPTEYTNELISVLKNMLKINPKHPNANHLYIHVMEVSKNPAVALPNADILWVNYSGLEHLAHMPSHIYIFTDRLHDASDANMRAIAAYQKYAAQCRKQGFEPGINWLEHHNYHFLWVTASYEGRYELADYAAKKLTEITTPSLLKMDPASQWFFMITYLNEIRFKHWDKILQFPKPPNEQKFLTGMWYYARGLAYVNTGHLPEASKQYKNLKKILSLGPIEENAHDFGHGQLRMASEILAANIAEKKDDKKEMLAHWEKALAIHEEIGTKEPPMWFFPVRRGLLRAYTLVGQQDKAIKLYYTVLKEFPGQPWLLHDLYEAQKANGQHAEAKKTYELFLNNWQYADVIFPE